MASSERRYHCPVEVTAELIGGKWTTVILAHLKQEPLRFSELRRLMPAITEKMLAQRLRELESGGLVLRTVLGDTPPHVRYELTAEGRSLGPALQALYDWGAGRARRRGLRIAAPRN